MTFPYIRFFLGFLSLGIASVLLHFSAPFFDAMPGSTGHSQDIQIRLTNVSLASTALINAENAQRDARQAFSLEQTTLLQLLEKKQAVTGQGGLRAERFRLWTAALTPAREFTVDASSVWISENTRAFHQAMTRVQRDMPSRQARFLDEAYAHWDACVLYVSKMAEAEKSKGAALAALAQARTALTPVFARHNSASGVLSSTLKQRLWSWVSLPYGWGSLVCLVVGMLLLWPSGSTLYKASIQTMAECVEAAAAGDLSRLPQVASEPGLERLAQGLIRLTAVVTRSENLVYHLAALVEASGDAIISQNLEGKILSWNKGAQRLYGYAVEEVRGQSIAILSPMDYGFQLKQILDRVKAGEKVSPFETLHQAKNGRFVQALVRVSAIYDSLHQVIGVSFCAQELQPSAKISTADSFLGTLPK